MNLLDLIRTVVRENPGRVIAAVGFSVFQALTLAVIPFLLHQRAGAWSDAAPTLALCGGLALASGLSGALSRRISVSAVQAWITAYRLRLTETYLRLSPGAFEDLDYFPIHFTVVTESEKLDRFLVAFLSELVPAVLIVSSLTVVLGWISWPGLLALTPVLSLAGWLEFRMRRRVTASSRRQQTVWKDWCATFWRVSEQHTPVHVKGTVAEELALQRDRLDHVETGMRDHHAEQANYRTVQDGLFLVVCLLLVVAYSVETVPALVVIILLLRSQARALLAALPRVADARDSWRRLAEIEKPDDPHRASGTDPLVGWDGSLHIRNLTFAYGNRPPLFQQLTLDVTAGEVLLIQGGNGRGKSTLIKLLLGFLKPESGDIFYGAQNLGDLDLLQSKAAVGVLTQDMSLGQQLSGGQKRWQAFLHFLPDQRRLYVLDEPSNHLDDAHFDALIDRIRSWASLPAVVVIASHDVRLEAVATQRLVLPC